MLRATFNTRCIARGDRAKRLATFFGASVELMQVPARAGGHSDLRAFTLSDLTTWKYDIANLSGVSFGGLNHE